MKTPLLPLLLLLLLLSPPLAAQSRKTTPWEPTGGWPFVHREFVAGTVYTGLFSRTKTIVPCNIHVAKHTLYYLQRDTLMEALPGSVLRVDFPHGESYMPVGSQSHLGRIVREDMIGGQIARVVCVATIDQQQVDQRSLDVLNTTQNILQGASALGLGSWASALADANGGTSADEQPLPLVNQFYFQVRGEIFPATTKNILSHIAPARRKAYRAFTRTAEIISTSERSMLKVWDEFFVKTGEDR